MRRNQSMLLECEFQPSPSPTYFKTPKLHQKNRPFCLENATGFKSPPMREKCTKIVRAFFTIDPVALRLTAECFIAVFLTLVLLREVDAEDPMPMPSEHLMELIYEYASLKSTPLAHNTLHPSALLATSIAVHEYMIELLTPMVKEHVQRCLDEEEGSVPIDDAPEIDLIDSSVPPDRHRILRRNSATMDDDNEFEAPEHSEEDEPEDVAPRSPTLSELLDEMDQASAAKNKSTRPFMDQD